MSDTPTLSEVENMYGKIANPDRAEQLIPQAERFVEDVLDDAVLLRQNLRGNRKDINVLMACHLIQLMEGGESQSKSQSGGNVSYNTVTGETMDTLSETRFGRMLLEYKRPRANISTYRTF